MSPFLLCSFINIPLNDVASQFFFFYIYMAGGLVTASFSKTPPTLSRHRRFLFNPGRSDSEYPLS